MARGSFGSSSFSNFDVFAVHCRQLALNNHHCKCTFGCTGELQQHSLTFNDPFYLIQYTIFTKWYAAIVKKELDQEKDVSTIKSDIRTSTIKPIHVHQLFIEKMGENNDKIVSGFEKAGVKDYRA